MTISIFFCMAMLIFFFLLYFLSFLVIADVCNFLPCIYTWLMLVVLSLPLLSGVVGWVMRISMIGHFLSLDFIISLSFLFFLWNLPFMHCHILWLLFAAWSKGFSSSVLHKAVPVHSNILPLPQFH